MSVNDICDRMSDIAEQYRNKVKSQTYVDDLQNIAAYKEHMLDLRMLMLKKDFSEADRTDAVNRLQKMSYYAGIYERSVKNMMDLNGAINGLLEAADELKKVFTTRDRQESVRLHHRIYELMCTIKDDLKFKQICEVHGDHREEAVELLREVKLLHDASVVASHDPNDKMMLLIDARVEGAMCAFEDRYDIWRDGVKEAGDGTVDGCPSNDDVYDGGDDVEVSDDGQVKIDIRSPRDLQYLGYLNAVRRFNAMNKQYEAEMVDNNKLLAEIVEARRETNEWLQKYGTLQDSHIELQNRYDTLLDRCIELQKQYDKLHALTEMMMRSGVKVCK
jgi:hypothetical protein